MAISSYRLWVDYKISRFFLIPEDECMPVGSLELRNLCGQSQSVAPENVIQFEVAEDEARRWAKDKLGQTLDELKLGIDEKLADIRQKLEDFDNLPVSEGSPVTPNAPSALFDLLKQLPRVIGQSLSGDDNRVEAARETMTDLQRRLKESGVDLDNRLSSFPDRLAELRKEVRRQEAAKTPKITEDPPKKS